LNGNPGQKSGERPKIQKGRPELEDHPFYDDSLPSVWLETRVFISSSFSSSFSSSKSPAKIEDEDDGVLAVSGRTLPMKKEQEPAAT
jgi:hypothetical protein